MDQPGPTASFRHDFTPFSGGASPLLPAPQRFVAPLLLQEIAASTDHLVEPGSERTLGRAEHEGALVAVLVSKIAREPAATGRIGDRLVVLVADQVDRIVGVVAARALAGEARAE